MSTLVEENTCSDRKVDQSYTRGIALGMRDIQEKRPLNQLYRLALDEFSFGYRAAYYLVLSGAAVTCPQ